MWKAVGTVNLNDNKKNRSKDQVNCEPFAQASRLRLNQSQLSGQQSHQFMNEYFTKRKSTEGILNRVLSLKTIEIRQSASPTNSLRQLQSPRNKNKTGQIQGVSVEIDSLHQIQKRKVCIGKESLYVKCQKIEEQLERVREQQSKIRNQISEQRNQFTEHMKLIERQINEKIRKIELDSQKNTRQNINPELLVKIRQEGTRFNEKMKDLDARKEQLKTRYKEKLGKE